MMIASIHSQAENDAVRKLLKTNSYLGATETAKNGVWKWDDGTPWDYVNPKNDGLKDKGETRLAFFTDGLWHDSSKGEGKHGVVCRFNGK